MTDAPPSLLPCSVVIPTRQRPEALAHCLDALLRLATGRGQRTAGREAGDEIIVVDNTHGDSATHDVAKAAGVRYMTAPSPGVGAARNAGAIAALGDIVAFLDDDAVPDLAWIDALRSAFTDPLVAAVTGPVLPAGETADAGRVARTLGAHSLFERTSSETIDRDVGDWFARAAFGGTGNGTNMAFRRALFASGFRFDERTGRGGPIQGFDEHLAFLTLVSAGHRIAYAPSAVVRHPVPATIEEIRRNYLRDRTALGAYTTLLFFEGPHRLKLLRFIGEACAGKHRAWRSYPPGEPPRIVSRAHVMLAYAAGPLCYFRSLLR